MDERIAALAALQQAQPDNLPLVGALRLGPEPEKRVGKKQIAEAVAALTEYKAGKVNLEKRIVEDELWYKQRHWEVVRRKDEKRPDAPPQPSSAWLFNAILNKHADAMDNYPEPVVLPREQSDEQSAKTLSSVLPVVMELCEFEETYSEGWWEKLKHGTACYGVFWDASRDNGIGDIAIREIDLLRVFWEPGITDIQKSRNLFIVELVDTDLLEQRYPEHKGKLGGNVIDLTQYTYDDAVDTSRKSLVVDWYYKRQSGTGQTVLHYCKFVGNTVLYASENEREYSDRGYYDHGQYPIVMDTLFPEEGTPVGFGYVAICKEPQIYIDALYANILEYAWKATRPRHFIAASTGVNEKEYNDWTKPLVHVEGTLDDTRIRQIVLDPMPSIYTNVIQLKIEELKDTAANRDVNSGGTGGGVTAASAIAALQEAGNKASRDMIAASYRAYVRIGKLCIELMRQFYDEQRSFRVIGAEGAMKFVQFSAQQIREQPTGMALDGETLYRQPVFDLKIRAQKKNPFSRMEQNERAKELYGLGFFNPERAQEALGALEMMDFEGIDKVREQARQGQTLLNVCYQLSAQLEQAMQIIGAMTGRPMQAAPAQNGTGSKQNTAPVQTGTNINSEIMQAQTPMTSYGQRLAERSVPSMEAQT